MPKKVLIVDDQAEVRRLVRLALELEGYELFEAENGSQAKEMIDRERLQIILLDVMLPGELDGYALCKMIKEDPTLSNMFVCLLTARGQQTDIEKGKQVGADAYVIKPFSPLELAEIVARAVSEES